MDELPPNDKSKIFTKNRQIVFKVLAVFGGLIVLAIIMNESTPPSNSTPITQTAPNAIEQTNAPVVDSPSPTIIEIKADSLVFTNFYDIKQYEDNLANYAKLLGAPSSPSDLANMSEDQATRLGQQMAIVLTNMTTNFKERGKVLDVPVGTQIAIKDYFDKVGNLTKPVWNDQQKAFYTSDGDLIYVSGEWQGKNVITLWPYSSNPNENSPAPTAAAVSKVIAAATTKDAWMTILVSHYGQIAKMHVIGAWNAAQFKTFMGEPDRTETVGDQAYWYYDCSDGTIQLVMNAPNLSVGLMEGNINDY